MRRNLSLLLFLITLCLPVTSYAQLWSGIISPSRAVDWTQAGFPGDTLPDSGWTQCATTACNTVTSAGASATAAQINAAISSASANTYVLLPAGTYTLSAGLALEQSNTVLRGMGANQTFLTFSSSPSRVGCFASMIAVEGGCEYANGGETNVCNWTSGYSQGSTTITLANCGSTTPAKGSISNLKVGSILFLDQLDEVNDTGTIWNCLVGTSENASTGLPMCAVNPTGNGGGGRSNGTCNGAECYRSQQQGVTVTSCDGITTTGHVCSSQSNIGISPGLYMPNWRSGQLPQAWFATTYIVNSGVENLSIDGSEVPAGASTIEMVTCSGCWVRGVRGLNSARSHVRMVYEVHGVVRDNYFYKNQTGGSVSYGAEMFSGFNNIVENNIFMQDTDSEPSCTAACEGNVIAYNLDINNVYTTSGWMQAGFYEHASGSAFNLWEGGIGPGYNSDDIHGTHHFDTLYRNYLIGNNHSLCDGSACNAQTIPIQMNAGSRYVNIIGNALGRASYHTSYTYTGSSSGSGNPAVHYIYVLGATGNSGNVSSGSDSWCLTPSCGSTGDYDPQTWNYLMRWGNYDVVTNAVRWCGNSSDTGWSTTCGSASEVPTGLASYSNAVPSYGDTGAGQSKMPASFYYSSAPNWWPLGKPWPLIGPDVTSGNVGTCSSGSSDPNAPATSSSQCTGGSLSTAMAGTVNSNPAMDCYLNTMGGTPSGTGSVLSFNADACYPLPPTGPAAAGH